MDNSWTLMRSTMKAQGTPRALAPGTLRRIGAFAKPHKWSLLVFLALSTISAVLAVATPVLAGRVVDAIVGRSGRWSSGWPCSSLRWRWSTPRSASPPDGSPPGSARG